MQTKIKVHPDLFNGDRSEEREYIKTFSLKGLVKHSNFWRLKVNQLVKYKQFNGCKIVAKCVGFNADNQKGRVALFETSKGYIEIDALTGGADIL